MVTEMHNKFKSKEKGAALLTVLVALLLISLMTLELQYTSLIERKLAYNDLNHLQAYYLAKSGAHIGLLRLTLLGKAMRDNNLKAYSKYFPDLWRLPFPPFPPDQADLAKVSLKEKSEQESLLDETRISAGKMTHSISSESSKINLNLLDNPTAPASCPNFFDTPKDMVTYLGHRLVTQIDLLFRESEDPTGEFGNVRPDMIICNIMDWIHPGQSSFGASNKDSWYETQNPPYKAKRARMFTVDELKLVKDITPALFLKLKPIVTVFSENGKTDIDQLTQRRELKTLFRDFTDRDLEFIYNHFQSQLAGSWGNVQTFTNFMSANFSRFMTNYPASLHNEFFTVGSRAFIIKSRGELKKSGSTIQSTITLAVALTTGAGANSALNLDPAQCNADPDLFFHLVLQKCFAKPTTKQECDELFPGAISFKETTTEYVCTPNGNVSPPVKRNKPTAGQEVAPRGLKIYSWVES
ncbi:MAG: hypothetical protein EB078_07230 [Proteobacteria bacterium]|nr:hypothetical protein [Pseudomonadota bacterium]NDC24810.1 hypothetical protein [Pseudomonadota bacterium]NDD04681.1 hypothetical protein [Pseudomonadota bacterium]NDG25689.1 hypothetical protein [Pseudomonadota bacterium]